MSGLRLDCGSNIRGPTETINTGRQLLQQVFKSWRSNTWSPVPYRGQLATTKATSSSRLNPGTWNTGLAAYLDLALIFLLLRFSLLILFFLHLALIALNHLSCRSESSNKSL